MVAGTMATSSTWMRAQVLMELHVTLMLVKNSTRKETVVDTNVSPFIGDSHDGQIFDGHGHVHDNRSQAWVVGFTRKGLTIVLVGWLA